MRRPPIPVALAVALLALSACGSPTQSTPEVDAVHPGAVAMGATSYVTVSGSGFDPSFSVDPATGQPAVDDGFTVTFAGQQSPEVSWRSPTTLVAALPAGLAAGTATVGVTAPDGGHGEKADALCVGAPATRSRLSIVYHGTLAIPTAINVESTPVGGGTATVLATGAGAQGLHPFAVSPDGRTVVYLHTQRGTTRTEQLIALHPQGSGVGILLHTEVAQQGKQVMDGFAFSPDSGTLVYVIDQRKLVAQDIPTDGGTAKDPMVLFDQGHAGSDVIADPAVAPTGKTVLFSKVSDPADNGMLVGEHLALYTVPLAGGTPTSLLDERDQGVSNGPGVYLPDGKGILFVSDRMGLIVPAHVYGKDLMVPASNLFILDPDTGKVKAVSPPTVEAFVQTPLAVSPDGRWAAASGVLLDLTKSMVDILLTDLKTGKIYRAIGDVQGQLPTVDVDPSFSPDGKTVYATAVTILAQLITKVQSYEVAVPDADPDPLDGQPHPALGGGDHAPGDPGVAGGGGHLRRLRRLTRLGGLVSPRRRGDRARRRDPPRPAGAPLRGACPGRGGRGAW